MRKRKTEDLTWFCGITGDFQKAYPDAKLIAVEEAVNKKKDEKLNWAGCVYYLSLRQVP